MAGKGGIGDGDRPYRLIAEWGGDGAAAELIDDLRDDEGGNIGADVWTGVLAMDVAGVSGAVR